MTKYKVIRDHKQLSLCDLEGKLSDVREYIDILAEQYGNDAELVLEWDYESVDLEVQFTREETDVERNKRLLKDLRAREKKAVAKAAKEEGERAELARLLKKFGEG